MAMQKIERNSYGNEIRLKLENPGQSFEGTYDGSESFQHKNKTIVKHRFKNSEGKVMSILGGHQLNEDLPKIPVGSFTRVTFDGKAQTLSGNTVKNYTIEFESNGL